MAMTMEVKIGHNSYKIIESNTQLADGNAGITYKDLSEIHISSTGLSEEIAKETLLHEILHAVCSHVGIQDAETLDEEQFISRISPTLLTVLRENPELVTLLTDE